MNAEYFTGSKFSGGLWLIDSLVKGNGKVGAPDTPRLVFLRSVTKQKRSQGRGAWGVGSKARSAPLPLGQWGWQIGVREFQGLPKS